MRPVTWLVCGDRVLTPVHVADTALGRLRGWHDPVRAGAAVLLTPCRSVHTFGMAEHLDVAQCTDELTVVRVTTVAPNRVCRPRRGVRCVIEAPAGAFSRWQVGSGSVLGVRRPRSIQ